MDSASDDGLASEAPESSHKGSASVRAVGAENRQDARVRMEG